VRFDGIITGHRRRFKPAAAPCAILKRTRLTRIGEPLPRVYSSTLRRRKALLTTETELNAIAAAATMGLSRIPNTG